MHLLQLMMTVSCLYCVASDGIDEQMADDQCLKHHFHHLKCFKVDKSASLDVWMYDLCLARLMQKRLLGYPISIRVFQRACGMLYHYCCFTVFCTWKKQPWVHKPLGCLMGGCSIFEARYHPFSSILTILGERRWILPLGFPFVFFLGHQPIRRRPLSWPLSTRNLRPFDSCRCGRSLCSSSRLGRDGPARGWGLENGSRETWYLRPFLCGDIWSTIMVHKIIYLCNYEFGLRIASEWFAIMHNSPIYMIFVDIHGRFVCFCQVMVPGVHINKERRPFWEVPEQHRLQKIAAVGLDFVFGLVLI